MVRRGPIPITSGAPERLNSWKEIAQYLGVSVRTVQRWENVEGLPVHRHQHEAESTVYSTRGELDAWLASRKSPPRPVKASSRLGLKLWFAVTALALGIGCGLLLLSRDARPGLEEGYRVRPLAASWPSQWSPAWSPDGKAIAFLGEKNGDRRLMVQSVNSPQVAVISPQPLRLTDRQFPFWSPDSEWVYCIGDLEGIDNSDNMSLYRVPAKGGAAVLVQPSTRAATISPDGRTLVTLSRAEDRNWRIWTATPPESTRERYEPEPFHAGAYLQRPTLAFAPRGDQIFLSINLPGLGPRQWLLPWPAGKPRSVPLSKMSQLNFAWMPDSRYLAALSPVHPELFLADAESGKLWPAARLDRAPAFPTVSPDGAKLAYQSQLSHTSIIAVPLNGGLIRTLLDTPATEEMPACSPVTDEIVYLSDRRGMQEVWIHDMKTEASRPLFAAGQGALRGSPRAGAPAFSPDGRQIVVRVGLSAEMNGLVVASARGESPARIVTKTPLAIAPGWSPDGNWLVFVQLVGDSYHVMKVRADGSGQPVALAATNRGQGVPAPMSLPEWSPAGDWIAFEAVHAQLSLVTPDGKTTRVLGGFGPVAWARDGKTLFQVRSQERKLVAVDVATAKLRVLRDLGDALPYAFTEPGRRVSLTRDGKNIVYSVLNARDEIWLLEGLRPRPPWYAALWRR